MTRPHWIVWLGMSAVLIAAAVLSFEGLYGLATAVGISTYLGWLLPIAVDAGAAVSCAVWLGGRSPVDAARVAGRMTWALLATTVAGNAAHLGMAAEGITPPWWVAVLVGAIPPAVVGAVVHLVVLLTRTDTTTTTLAAADRPAAAVSAPAEKPAEDTTTPTKGVALALVDEPEDDLLPAVREWASRHDGTPSQRQIRAEFGVGAARARKLWEAVA